MDIIFSRSDYFFQSFVFVVVALVLVFVISKVAKVGFGAKVRGSKLPFGMTTNDIERLASNKSLTEEELKKVRQAMGRQYLEREKEQEHLRQLPASAELALQEAQREYLAEEREQPASSPAPTPPLTAPKQEIEEPMIILPAHEPLPQHLESLLERPEFELDAMREAGFLTDEDHERLIEEKRIR